MDGLVLVRDPAGGAVVLTQRDAPAVLVRDARPTRLVLGGFRGVPGQAGDKGDTGTGIQLKGTYATLADLQTAHPTGTAGDAYAVGGDLYVWQTDSSAWANAGAFRGPDGAPGQIRFVGTGAPGTIIGASPGDTYLDMSTGTIYQLT